MTSDPQQFASDNYAGICPEAFAAMAEANHGHEISYGNDTWTDKAANMNPTRSDPESPRKIDAGLKL